MTGHLLRKLSLRPRGHHSAPLADLQGKRQHLRLRDIRPISAQACSTPLPLAMLRYLRARANPLPPTPDVSCPPPNAVAAWRSGTQGRSSSPSSGGETPAGQLSLLLPQRWVDIPLAILRQTRLPVNRHSRVNLPRATRRPQGPIPQGTPYLLAIGGPILSPTSGSVWTMPGGPSSHSNTTKENDSDQRYTLPRVDKDRGRCQGPARGRLLATTLQQ